MIIQKCLTQNQSKPKIERSFKICREPNPMTNLDSKLAEVRAASDKNIAPEKLAIMQSATEALRESTITEQAPKAGEKLADFLLPNQVGVYRSLKELLRTGPAVITFYRGGWCPYCNLELRAYQDVLQQINDAGATLIAITPELPDASMSTQEKNELQFEVLSDANSEYARQLGLVFTLPEELRPVYESFGIYVEQHNGDGQYDLPLAATFIIDTSGKILSAFVDADYRFRKEPTDVVKELLTLS